MRPSYKASPIRVQSNFLSFSYCLQLLFLLFSAACLPFSSVVLDQLLCVSSVELRYVLLLSLPFSGTVSLEKRRIGLFVG